MQSFAPLVLVMCISMLAFAVPARVAAVVIAPDSFHAPATRRMSGVPSVAVSPSGRCLWATWYAGKTNGEDSNNYCVLAMSSDEGRTWKEVLIADPDGDGPIRSFDSEVWVAPDGDLRWTWTERRVELRGSGNVRYPKRLDGRDGDRLMMVAMNSERVPMAPYPKARDIGAGVMMCKPIVLRNGHWLFPVAYWEGPMSAHVLKATKEGRNFTPIGGVTIPPWVRECEEHNLVELANGHVRAYMRTRPGPCGCWVSESADGGVTWDDPRPANFPHTNARLFVRRLKSGRLLLVKNGPLDKDVGRKRLSAFLSEDDGRTWKGELVLAKDSCAYPDGDQMPDGTIVIVYDNDRYERQDIHLVRFTEEDVFAGKNVSGRVVLDGIVFSR